MNLQLDTRDVNLLRPIPDTSMCIRICNAIQDLEADIREFDHRDGATANAYVVPEMHQIENFLNQGIDIFQGLGAGEQNEEDFDEENVDEEHEPIAHEESKYQGKGLMLRVDQLSNYVPRTQTTVCCTLYQGTKVVKRADNIDCQFLTTPKDVSSVRDDPDLRSNEDDKDYGKHLRINEHVLWE